MTVSSRLQKLRKKNGYSQEELAEKLGVSRQAISKWENEQGYPDMKNVIKLSELYGVSTYYILKSILKDSMERNNKNKSEHEDALCKSNSETGQSILKLFKVLILSSLILLAIFILFIVFFYKSNKVIP